MKKKGGLVKKPMQTHSRHFCSYWPRFVLRVHVCACVYVCVSAVVSVG